MGPNRQECRAEKPVLTLLHIIGSILLFLSLCVMDFQETQNEQMKPWLTTGLIALSPFQPHLLLPHPYFADKENKMPTCYETCS